MISDRDDEMQREKFYFWCSFINRRKRTEKFSKKKSDKIKTWTLFSINPT